MPCDAFGSPAMTVREVIARLTELGEADPEVLDGPLWAACEHKHVAVFSVGVARPTHPPSVRPVMELQRGWSTYR